MKWILSSVVLVSTLLLAACGGTATPPSDAPASDAAAPSDSAGSGVDVPAPSGVACGARAGNTCSDKEFCAYKPGAYCGAADAQATCAPRPEMCAELFMPVCGCDDKTYSSECHANQAGVGIHSEGECAAK